MHWSTMMKDALLTQKGRKGKKFFNQYCKDVKLFWTRWKIVDHAWNETVVLYDWSVHTKICFRVLGQRSTAIACAYKLEQVKPVCVKFGYTLSGSVPMLNNFVQTSILICHRSRLEHRVWLGQTRLRRCCYKGSHFLLDGKKLERNKILGMKAVL